MIYRREIDGLRALAVLPVILFCAGFAWVGGGFVVRSSEEMAQLQLAQNYVTVVQAPLLVKRLKGIYSNIGDDNFYSSSKHLDYIADGQDFYFRVLKVFAGLCIFLGVFLIACAVKPDCRPCRWVREGLLRTLALFRRKSR